MAERVIHLVFKTHLDIGFTDHAQKVREQYHRRFIPQAIETGEHFFAEDPEHPKFIWTTGAWLIWDHLNSQPKEAVARLERAIGRGLIRWHGLPFTTHSELMSPALFEAGLSFSAELDQRFGKSTIAAKMTDVPGHTLGIVPLMAMAGLKFLHIGVNTASPPPEVPDVFRWRAPMGEEIVVMYQKSYGATHFPEGFSEGLSFAHTSDNIGPQSVPQTVDAYRALRYEEPDPEIRAATLEDYGALLWERREEFPVVDIELGDNWIHGTGSDPIKLGRFMALQRLYDGFAETDLTDSRRAFGRGLTLVAEHTWGVDIKSYLRDDRVWDRPDFEAARRKDYRFAYSEASWAEQRAYLDAAVAELGSEDRKKAESSLAVLAIPEPPALTSTDGGPVQVGNWIIDIDAQTGGIAAVTAPDGTRLAGESGSLIGYRYESYDAADVKSHMQSYLTHWQEWAILDHDKPGLARAKTAQSAAWMPKLKGTALMGETLVLGLEMPETAYAQLGAPQYVEIRLAPVDSGLELAFILRGKPANRMPEASFVHVTPAHASRWTYRKMGLWQPGDRIAHHGGGQLQAVSAVQAVVAQDQRIEIVPLDTPLVAPVATPFMPFCPTPPDLSKGIRFNLHNNKWGTNFPMWWEGDFCARFVLRLAERFDH